MYRILLILLSVLSVHYSLTQKYTDSSYISVSKPTIFMDSNNLTGFKKNERIIVGAQFRKAFGFNCNLTTVADTSNRYGIIKKNGKWAIEPSFQLISPVLNKYYITLKDSVFQVYKGKRELYAHKGHFDVDYKEYVKMIQESDIIDKDLILRVLKMYGVGYPTTETRDNYLDEQRRMYFMLSKTMLTAYWSTDWILSKLIGR
ncbi:hypothetical protein K6119_11300 [Paracrocinitomix mangrovi]|uniref:hypothetical protein n=1 Tax=Paracrocinitomix mangrovi TaxID=2862509 RepID=UPI001C8DC7CA|nr:hypothetical protein [Paracrocinitomix mangrovi]UKN00320.1 hypothetical protein K6119_11300 [Paracrocinitomix mangrovi]